MPLKSRLSFPMVLAAIILLAGFGAIAWTVQWSQQASGMITEAANAGVAALPVPVANSIGGALPAFVLDLDGATMREIPATDSRWLHPAPLDRMEVGISALVWLDAWWNCAFITHDYHYLPVGFNPDHPTGQDAVDVARWDALIFRQQQNVKEACR